MRLYKHMSGRSSWTDKADCRPNWSEAVRTAIGEGLRAHYLSPLELPADLLALVSRLSATKTNALSGPPFNSVYFGLLASKVATVVIRSTLRIYRVASKITSGT
jgi:hypothetical protein